MALTTNKIKKKKGVEKITMLTCYDYQMAKILDAAGVDMLLIGDSVGNVALGFKDTTMVTMPDMIHHVAAVARGAENAFVVSDMPFLSYNLTIADTLKNAGDLIRAGAKAVKVEGGEHIIEHVKALTDVGIPVVGHLGLTPQAVNQLGGYLIQGKTNETANKIINDALLLQKAGAFCLVLECVPGELAEIITEKLDIPTIGIGAGTKCDGQVLVINDVLGMSDNKPNKFVKQYANLYEVITNAVTGYINDVKEEKFPAEDNIFHATEKLY